MKKPTREDIGPIVNTKNWSMTAKDIEAMRKHDLLLRTAYRVILAELEEKMEEEIRNKIQEGE